MYLAIKFFRKRDFLLKKVTMLVRPAHCSDLSLFWSKQDSSLDRIIFKHLHWVSRTDIPSSVSKHGRVIGTRVSVIRGVTLKITAPVELKSNNFFSKNQSLYLSDTFLSELAASRGRI
jgi:hypothetical protein